MLVWHRFEYIHREFAKHALYALNVQSIQNRSIVTNPTIMDL